MNKKNSSKLNLYRKQESSGLLLKADFEKFDYDFNNMLGWTHYPNYCFATIIDNKIVSCASAGYHTGKANGRVVEISTKTHADYKKNGYAVSNVVALCEYILNMPGEKEIHYITDTDNIASQKTALSAGLAKIRYINILLKKLKSKIGFF